MTAAALAATLPMGVLQATSTQNDLVAASWLAVSVFIGLCVLRCPKAIVLLPFTTLAFGLAALAKPTVFPMAGGLAVVWLGCLLWRRVPLLALVFSAVLVLLPSTPFYVRNLVYFGPGSPYGPAHGLPNEELSVVGVTSNLLRYSALHGQIPLSGAVCDAFNASVLGLLRKCHEVLPVSINDPRFTIEKGNAFQPKHKFHEDITGNPLHFILFLLFLPLAVLTACRTSAGAREGRQRVAVRRALPLMLCVAAGLVTVWGYLKWSPFACRYDLALFVVACIPLGGLVAGLQRGLRGVLLLACVALAFTAICLNAIRPVAPLLNETSVDRRASYFANRPDLLTSYVEISRAIKAAGCHQIGYRPGTIGAYQFEYPFWVLLGEGGYSFRFEHVGVVSPSGRAFRDASFSPCAIISPGGKSGSTRRLPAVSEGKGHVSGAGSRETGGPDARGPDTIGRLAFLVLAALLAFRVILLPVLAWNSRYVMDEYGQASYPLYIPSGFYDGLDPIKTVLYIYVFDVAHRFTHDAVDLLHFARMEGVLLAFLAAGVTFGITRRLGRSRFEAWFAVSVLFSFTNFMERSFRIRSDTVAVAFAACAAFVSVGGRGAGPGVSLGPPRGRSVFEHAEGRLSPGRARPWAGGLGHRGPVCPPPACTGGRLSGGIGVALVAYGMWFRTSGTRSGCFRWCS